jgi:prephenate dehydratase/chorismate mutase/prephenate dehydratase
VIPTKLAYLGPRGTFAQAAAEAARTVRAHGSGDVSVVDMFAAADVEAVIRGVEDATYDYGVVPIENSVHGMVLPTLDHLVFAQEGVLVREEVVVPVTFVLFGHGDADNAAPPKVVLSHPHALAQCRDMIAARGLVPEEASSTAEACRLVATTRLDALCIAAPHAGGHYGLRTIATAVEDRDGGSTRFYVLGRALTAETGRDVRGETFRTGLVLTPGRDRPGILLEMLRPFAERGVNLSSLMSRPLRSGLGLYCFILVVDAHSSTPELGAALSELLDHGVRIKNLGSYLAWRSAAPAAGAHAEYPRGSVAASDDPDRQRRVLLPPTDPAQ